MSLPVSVFLSTLRKGELLPPQQMADAERLAVTLTSADTLAAALVGRAWLTQFQADELCAGRGASLVVGPYVLLDRLGKGGMGEVFRARHKLMSREVALKRMKEELLASPELVARFLREVRAASLLSHPGVVQVHDAGEANGVHYLAMELLRGVNLADYLGRRGQLPIEEAVEYVRQACVGMQHAHEQGMVHRDLKPANLWLTQQRQVKILDLGLALLTHASTMTHTGVFFGTVDYVAPEQVSDSHNVDIRADIYSLGCTLYQLLAGQTPFTNALPVARAVMHLTQEPPPIEQCRAEVSPDVAAVVRKMMAKKREDRYQTPGEAATALAALLSETGVSAPALGSERSALVPPSVLRGAPDVPPTEGIGAVSRVVSRPLPGTEVSRPGRSAGKNAVLLPGLLGGVLLLGFVSAFVVSLLLGSGKDSDKHATDNGEKDRDGLSKQGERGSADDKDRSSKDNGDKDKTVPNKDGSTAKDNDHTPAKGKDSGPPKDADKGKSPPVETSFTNSVGMKFVRVKAGKFMMGSPQDEKEANNNEKPQHEVQITRDFYLGIHEVTQKQYKAVMDNNPSWFCADGEGKDAVKGIDTNDFPVERVSWEDAQAFLKKLNGLAAEMKYKVSYRLPTEAEWEYSCRGGHLIAKIGKKAELPFHFEQPSASLGFGQANFGARVPYGGQRGNALNRSCPVGRYEANSLGLFDMHGNVHEWCQDWYAEGTYAPQARRDPTGPLKGAFRVVRGGGWGNDGRHCRAAVRGGNALDDRYGFVGFRVAAVPSE